VKSGPLLRDADLQWYARRVRGMSGAEVVHRGLDGVRRETWRRYRGMRPVGPACRWLADRHFSAALPPGATAGVSDAARASVVHCADQVLAGHYQVLGRWRHDLDDPDWFRDPLTGRRAPASAFCFHIPYRREEVTGNVKQLWELSRMPHVTVLAAAFSLTGEQRYADGAGRQLQSWWSANPPLSGVHWTSGIELGIRLVSWVWTRRLLDGWSGAAKLFEENAEALHQIWWHQRFLAAFPSRGSSANNHVIAEAVGSFVAALAFPWFHESERWADRASALLQAELVRNTFPSGVDRELASDYQALVTELAVIAGVEGDRAGYPLADETWERLCRMIDVAAATVDQAVRGPRQGDGDGGRALQLGPPEGSSWKTLLAFGREAFGSLPWWPTCEADVVSTLWATLTHRRLVRDRPRRRPTHIADAGITILRTPATELPEIWCRCDGGPHGFPPIAAHAHADALSVEVRYGGVDILADPGTYCYHGDRPWRDYFRSTLAHNTVEIDGTSQSRAGGPFLWTSRTGATVTAVEVDPSGDAVGWTAVHDGYAVLPDPARHRRRVRMDREARRIDIDDQVVSTGPHHVRLAFHLGPEVRAELGADKVALTWSTGSASLEVPGSLVWSLVRGETGRLLGWYSLAFGQRCPTTTVLGEGISGHSTCWTCVLRFH